MTTPGFDVLVVSPIRPRQMDMLTAEFRLHRLDLSVAPENLLSEVGDRIGAIVTTGGVGADATLISALPNLRIIATSSVGVDKIDLTACRTRGIIVTNTPAVLTEDVADLGFGLLIATQRRLVEADAWVRSGDWSVQGAFPLTTSLAGLKVGILGFGAIGQAVARRCEAFRMEVANSSRSARDVPYRHVPDALALATWAEVLILCLPGGAGTRHLVGREVLDALGPDGTLINVARGSVVDEAALISALEEGRLKAAGLDVYETEPYPDPRLLKLRQVVLHPHHASGTVATRDAMAQLVVDNILAWRDTGRGLTEVVG